MILTEDDDIENQNGESNDPTATTVFPGVVEDAFLAGYECLLGHRKGEESELEKHAERVLEHCWYCSGSNEEIRMMFRWMR